MRACRAVLTVLLFAASSGAVLAQNSAFKRGYQARFAGQLDAAERAFAEALRADPQHYRALYNMGLVYEGRAVRAPAGEPRLRHFRTAVAWLQRAYRSPQRASSGEHAYTIYNSLGLMYLALGDLQQANRYLQEGYRHRNRLSEKSKGRLYANIGYLYALQGDVKNARRFFAEGARLRSNFATESLRRLDAAGIR